VVACQTYEGGFSAEPHHGGEAHGGYTFCAVATLVLLGKVHLIDVEALRGWLARRHCSFEGGFSGRANKLADGCYSFWQGASMALVNLHDAGLVPSLLEDNYSSKSQGGQRQRPPIWAHGVELEPVLDIGDDDGADIDLDAVVDAATQQDPLVGGLLFDQGMLQRYIALCAQDPAGGFRDKPSKSRDFYHSCYNLSGWSVSQHVLSTDGIPVIWGHPTQNRLQPTHPILNIELSKAQNVIDIFYNTSNKKPQKGQDSSSSCPISSSLPTSHATLLADCEKKC
jgi:protein farnesyltransferase subunit beta